LGLELEKERVVAEFIILLAEGLVKVRDFGYVLRNVEIVVFGLTNICFEDGNAFVVLVARIKADIVVCVNVLGEVLVTYFE
jgi:hypothetical protein